MKSVAYSMTEMEQIILNLRKKLDIAVNALEEYGNHFNWQDCDHCYGIANTYKDDNGFFLAKKALFEIKEVK